MRKERKNDMKKRMTKFICLMLVLVLAMGMLAACGKPEQKPEEKPQEEAETEPETESETNPEEEPVQEATVEYEVNPNAPTEDREGNPIAVPAEITKIASFAPSINQVLESLGLLDKVVAIDTNTPMYVSGVDSIAQFNMMEPDVEQIAALEPNIVFTTGMSYQDNDPYAALKEMGICVIVIPSSSSIEAIKEDITFIAQCFDDAAVAKATEINDEFQAEIDKIAAIGAIITEKKRVMFEIAALPSLYSFGKGTFLDEMITIIGAENVFGDQEAWIAVTEEDAVAANPDVILTSVNYIEDSVGEILGREGWENVNAVKNKEVYYIDNGASSLPNQYIIKALQQMAEAVYPDVYEYEDVLEPAA